MEIEKEFLPGKKILLVVSSGDYYKDILDSMKRLHGKSICYVSLNKTHKALREDFAKNGIDMKDMIIVDAISKTVKPNQEVEQNSYFVSSPGAFTELSMAVKKFLDYNFEYMIFDSLNSLLVYRDPPIVKRWIFSTMKEIKNSNTRAIFYTLSSEGQKGLIKEVSALVDNVFSIERPDGDGGGVVAFSGKLKE